MYLWKAVPDGLFCNEDAKQATLTRKRVDFSALLPTEIVLEASLPPPRRDDAVRRRGLTRATATPKQICAYLLPPSLHAHARVNKRLYATLTSETGSAMWRRKLEAPNEMPKWMQAIFGTADRRTVFEDSDDSDAASVGSSGANTAAQRRKRQADKRKLPLEQQKPLSPFKIASLYHYSECQVLPHLPLFSASLFEAELILRRSSMPDLRLR